MTNTTLSEVAAVVLKAAGLRPDTPLSAQTNLLGGGLSLDSVTILELLLALEQQFGIELDARELFEAQAMRTLGSLAEFVEARRA